METLSDFQSVSLDGLELGWVKETGSKKQVRSLRTSCHSQFQEWPDYFVDVLSNKTTAAHHRAQRKWNFSFFTPF